MKAQRNEARVEMVVGKITAAYVNRLNKMAQANCESWVEVGRLIEAYAQEIREKAKRKNPDVDRLLSEHADSILHASQIRNYRQAFKLWKDIGGDEGKAPRVPVTCFTVVLNAKINRGKKEAFLRMAESERLSVSELKARIGGRTMEEDNHPLFDARKAIDRITAGLTQAYDSLSAVVAERPANVTSEVKKGLVRLLRFSISQGILSLHDVEPVVEGGEG